MRVWVGLVLVTIVGCGDPAMPSASPQEPPTAASDPCIEAPDSEACTASVAFGTGYEVGHADALEASEEILAFLANRYPEAYELGFGDGLRVGRDECGRVTPSAD